MKTILLSFLCCSFISLNAQRLLEINIYQGSNSVTNGYSLDGQAQEYGALQVPALYLVVIDTSTCTPWTTIYIPEIDQIEGHDLFNFNQLGNYRPRQEAYFAYFQNDSTQMNGLNTAINDSIANGQLFFIYAPTEYNFNQIQALSPALAATLISYGGVSAGQNHIISLLVAKKGVPDSYHYEFNDNLGSEIHYSDTICKSNTLSAQTLTKDDFSIKKTGTNTYQISGTSISNLEIVNVLGQKIDFTTLNATENSIIVEINGFTNDLLIFKSNHFSSLFFKN